MKLDFLKNKKGIDVMISWILLIAISLSLGILVYTWVRNYSESTASDLENRSIESRCELVYAALGNACQTANELYFDITNKKDLKIKGFLFGIVDIFGNAENREINETLLVGETKRITIMKQGTIARIEAVPIIRNNEHDIYCVGVKSYLENIRYC
ncbi:MAG: hypothetical protein ACP5OZ_03280 [Candidatus Woesearchaeota archaeon]